MKIDKLVQEARKHAEMSQNDDAYVTARKAVQHIGPDSNHPAIPELLDIIAGATYESSLSKGTKAATWEELHEIAQIGMHHVSSGSEIDNCHLASALACFGRQHYDKQMYEVAEALETRAVQYLEQTHMKAKAAFLDDFACLVYSQCWQQKFDDALASAHKWLKLAEEELVENDIYNATIHKTLADICRETGDFEKAEEHYKRSLRLHEDANCIECADLPGIVAAYASFLRQLNREEEARSLEQRALETAE